MDYTVQITKAATEGSLFSVKTHQTTTRSEAECGRTFLVGGVDKPIYRADYTATGSYKEDGNIADVATELEGTGYTLKSTDGILVAGENKLPATYTGTYYGDTPYTRDDVNVIVNATEIKKATMKIVDKDNAVLKSDRMKAGQTYTLGYEAVGTKLLGFKEGDNFYPAGKEIAITEASEDTTFTAVLVDFGTLDGAQVRMLSDEKGYAGIRFTARIAKADNDAWKDLFDVKSIIVPTDKIEGAFEYNEANAEAFTYEADNYLVNGEDYELNFGYTNLLYSNYNRAFSALTYLEVTYTGDTTPTYIYSDYSAEKNSRSIYDVAKTLYAKHENALTTNGVGLYSEANVAYLLGYIDKVVDISIVDGEIAEADTGLDVDKAYTVSGTVENNTVTLTVVFDEALPTEFFKDGALLVPVNVWTSGEYVRIKTPTVAYDTESKTATITFTVS